jgi:hypothetical protein
MRSRDQQFSDIPYQTWDIVLPAIIIIGPFSLFVASAPETGKK